MAVSKSSAATDSSDRVTWKEVGSLWASNFAQIPLSDCIRLQDSR